MYKRKSNLVKEFFSNTDGYLKNNSNIMLRKKIIKKMLDNPRRKSIIDIGCGDGDLSLQFLNNNNQITLLDVSANMLDEAKKNISADKSDSVKLINSDFLEYNFHELFDIVMCVGVLAHVDSVDDTILKIVKILKPGGKCILQLTNYSSLIGKILISYYWLIITLKQKNVYYMNKIRFLDIIKTTEKVKLKRIKSVKYFSLLPGMGFINQKSRYKFQRFTMNNTILSKFGSEVFILFKKEGSLY